MNAPGSPLWLQALQRPEAYAHPAEDLHCLETHISWVLLAGEHAYKIKKPVDLGFLDYSTPEKRHFYCQEELRLNRRLAAPLYLGLSRITGPPEAARMDGDGEVLEYAVHMRRFPAENQFDHLLTTGRLRNEHLETLAMDLAHFHGHIAAPAPPESDYGRPERVFGPMRDNFDHLEGVHPYLPALRQWTEAQFQALQPALLERRDQGRIRECHGDLHLGNIVLWEGHPLPFDGIEFSPELRWIDIQSEMAFLTMDLEERGRPDLAWLTLNTWLSHSGDYPGLPLLRFYQTYRALVRAKVSHIRLQQGGLSSAEARSQQTAMQRYLELAHRYTRPRPKALIITSGVSGSGKSHLAKGLAMAIGAIHIRSDVERKRLRGLEPLQASHGTLYDRRTTEATYRRLRELAADILQAGFPVIVDATFLRRDQRAPFRALAQRLDVPFHILHTHAPRQVLEQRIRQRMAEGRDPSEADFTVLRGQLARQEPWSDQERPHLIDMDTTSSPTFRSPPPPRLERDDLETLLTTQASP